MNKVKLEAVLEALELSDEDGKYYYNKITSEVIYIGEEEARIADSTDIEENWDNYISLPSQFDINEYDIMVEFCYSLENDRISNELLSALNGKGAFRKFKDTAIRLNLEEKWYKYKDEALIKIARDWCKDNDIEVIKGN